MLLVLPCPIYVTILPENIYELAFKNISISDAFLMSYVKTQIEFII